jgi:hypothetical protein
VSEKSSGSTNSSPRSGWHKAAPSKAEQQTQKNTNKKHNPEVRER